MKIARVGIQRDPGFLYYLKDGDVWRSPMKRPGMKAKGKAERVASVGARVDFSTSIAYLDSDGDIATKPRANAKKSGKKKSKR